MWPYHGEGTTRTATLIVAEMITIREQHGLAIMSRFMVVVGDVAMTTNGTTIFA